MHCPFLVKRWLSHVASGLHLHPADAGTTSSPTASPSHSRRPDCYASDAAHGLSDSTSWTSPLRWPAGYHARRGSATAGTPFTITVTARDPVALSPPDTPERSTSLLPIPELVWPCRHYTFIAADNGAHIFAVTLSTSGSRTVTVADTVDSALTVTGTWNVTAGAAASLAMTPAGGSAIAGTASMSRSPPRCLRQRGNRVYRNVQFSSTDSATPTLPANYTFTVADSGTHVFTAVSRCILQAHDVTVTDTANAT